MNDVHSGQHGTLPSLDAPGDAELISAVRGGDVEAYGVLFERHVDAARRLARQLVSAGDVDDLVSESFAKVLSVLQRGGGPDLAFRAYLLTSLRRLHVDKLRAGARLTTTDDLAPYDPGVPFEDTAVSGFENAAAAKAFASLPERWQQVLWHTEVEGQKPAEIAPLLGMSANSVSALAYRAREGLRQAFVSMHAQDAADDDCAATRANLGAYLRGGISRRDAAKVEAHLQECRECSGIYLELAEVNSDLGAVLAPILLGSLGAGYLAASHLAAAGAVKGGVLLFLDRGKDWALHNPVGRVAAGAGGVAAAAAVATGLALGLHGGSPSPVAAPKSSPAPSTTSSTPPAISPPVSPPAKHTATPPVLPDLVSDVAASTPSGPAVPPATPTTPATPGPTKPVIRTPLAPVTVPAPGQPVTIDLTRGAVDPNGDRLSVVSARVAAPAHGTVVIERGATARSTLAALVARLAPLTNVTYTPNVGWRGTDTIDYVLGDGHGGRVSGSVAVTTPNAAPTAAPDAVDVASSWLAPTTTRIPVLANDSDANGDSLVVSGVSGPAHGTAVIESDGTVGYTPAAAYAGSDSFTYTISDGYGGTASATVSITVGALADRPPAAVDDTATADADRTDPATIGIDVLANDSDPDHDPLHLVSVGSADHGVTGMAGDEVTYRPDPGAHDLTDIFSYTVSDGRGQTATGTVSVHVGPLPDRLPDLSDVPTHLAIGDDGTAVITVPEDPDGDALTVTASTSAGSVAVSGRTITYTPPFGQDSTATVSYTVSDGLRQESGTTTVTASMPRSVLSIDAGYHSGPYIGTKIEISGIPAGHHVRVTMTATGFTGSWHYFTSGKCLNSDWTITGTTATLTCTIDSSANGQELGHFDPYASELTVVAHALDFVADDVTWSHGS